jgi:hypothetical protein
MKTKNKRELEKYWAKEAAKKAKPKKTVRREDANQAAAQTVKDATK